MRAHLDRSHAKADCFLCFWLLSQVLWEHILRAVYIFDEFKVIDLVVVAAIAVFANNEVVHLRIRRHEVESLKHAQELSLRNVELLGTVKVLESVFK